MSDVDKKGEMADPTWMPTDVVVRNVDKKGEWLTPHGRQPHHVLTEYDKTNVLRWVA